MYVMVVNGRMEKMRINMKYRNFTRNRKLKLKIIPYAICSAIVELAFLKKVLISNL